MTVSSTNTIRQFNGDGSTAAFAYNFKVFADADLQVIVRSATGVESVKSSGTHYNASGIGETAGGTVTFTSGNIPASGETITLRRAKTIAQELDLVANDPFPAANLEDQLDKLTHLILQTDEELDRALKLSRTNTMTSTEFTQSATDRANKVLSFDSTGELAVTQELGTYKGTSATTTTAAFTVRDIVKGSTTAQLNNIYICVADSVAGDSLTDTDHFALIVDAVSAATSATTASTQATAAASSATAAASSASTASTQASNASSSASTASTQATNAASSATAAAASAASAATALDNFDDVYLGAKSSDPSTDNDGDSLNAGDLYFNTSSSVLKVYDGSSWDAIESFTTGISNTNIPVFTSGVVDNDFLKVDGTSIEGRSASEVLSDIGASAVAGSSSIVTTGALNSGSITSGFGTIDTGSSTITTTGEVSAGRVNLSSAVASGDLGSDAAQVGYSSADGLLLMGQGSTNDVSLINDTGSVIAKIPTGQSLFLVDGPIQANSATGGKVYLTTSETTVVADDVLGAVEWYSPGEASGTDSIAKAASIEVVAEGEFTASANPSKMEFKLGVSEAATTKMTLTSSGNVGIGTSSPSSQVDGAANLVIGGTSDADSGMTFVTSTSGQGLIHFSDATSGNARFDGFIGYEQNNQAMKFGTAQTERWRITSDGHFKAATNGLGIDFSASEGTDATSSILDDYEEGEFVVGCNNSVTLKSASDTMAYTKIGRLVVISGQIQVDNDNSNAGFAIHNLPFTAMNGTESAGESVSGSIRLYNWNVDSDIINPVCWEAAGTTTLYFTQNKDNAAEATLLADADAYIKFTYTYMAT